ncbi:MAG TPA: SMP-30/gluconolactonase/LRE family protein [Chthonomonadaceae bacterium]|nr:SMP-30/gluconolactonase/LRE family protein [Chthonomonadaceae bacterium]
MQPELIADYACVVGENPLWHPVEQRLYWTDIDTKRLFWYEPETGMHQALNIGRKVGGFTIQADGALLLFMDRGTVQIWRAEGTGDRGQKGTGNREQGTEGKREEGREGIIIEEIPEERESRFNDVIADPAGRVFCGTMSTPAQQGSLYRLDTDGTITRVLEDIACSNGMGFSRDRRTMYYTDSERYAIYAFDYDAKTGALSNRRIFAQNPESEGLPDGMTVDAEGCLWSARWDGSCLVRYTPEGKEMQRVAFPVKKVSSIVFGGPDYEDIYVTTAGGDKKETDGAEAGSLYRLQMGIHGVPEFPSRIRL